MSLGSKDISKLKMVALTKNGYSNIVWYSPIKQNDKDIDFIITGMLRRFERHKSYPHTQCVYFYSTTTNELVKKLKKN